MSHNKKDCVGSATQECHDGMECHDELSTEWPCDAFSCVANTRSCGSLKVTGSASLVPGSLQDLAWGLVTGAVQGRSDLPSRITAIILRDDKLEDEFVQAHIDANETSSQQRERERDLLYLTIVHILSLLPKHPLLSLTHSNKPFIFHQLLEIDFLSRLPMT